MATLTNGYTINGVLDTGVNCLDNLQKLATAAGSWVTYDSIQGRWAVVINQAGDVVKAFNDNNIIGSINISSTGLTELYNAVEAQFPHKDLTDRIDYIKLTIPEADKFPNEPTNVLTAKYDVVNHPVQAQNLSAVQLNQSRLDKIIQFRTDYSALSLLAGDVISVTSDMYGFSAKKFRVTQVAEEDAGDNTLILSITALEYDSALYSANNLIRTERSTVNGISAKTINATTNFSGLTPIVKAFTSAGVLNTPAGDYVYDLGQTITIPVTGKYFISYAVNWGTNRDAIAGQTYYGGFKKLTSIRLVDQLGTVYEPDDGATGSQFNVQIYEDQYVSTLFTFPAGYTISFFVRANTDYGPGKVTYGINQSDGSVVSQTVPTGARGSIYVTATVQFVSET